MSTDTHNTGPSPTRNASALTSALPTQNWFSTSKFAILNWLQSTARVTPTTFRLKRACASATSKLAQPTTSGTSECALASACNRNAQLANFSTTTAAAADHARTKDCAKQELSSSTPRLAVALASQSNATNPVGPGATLPANASLLAARLRPFRICTQDPQALLALTKVPVSISQPAHAFHQQAALSAMSLHLTTTHSIWSALRPPVESTPLVAKSGLTAVLISMPVRSKIKVPQLSSLVSPKARPMVTFALTTMALTTLSPSN